jgi:hypothetical protein
MSLWTTRSAELVGIGDTVALSVLEHADAIGRIVARTDDGRIQCLLVCHDHKFINVDEDQLLLRINSYFPAPRPASVGAGTDATLPVVPATHRPCVHRD